jgi:predicted phage terminase large subunit-like protein
VSGALTSEEIELWQRLEGLAGADSILDFVPFMTPVYSRPAHLRPLADLFHRAEQAHFGGGPVVRGLVSTPPRHAKTETILHAAARFISRHPEKTVGYATYAADLAHSKSRKCREIAERAGVRLRRDSHAAKEWRTLQGGGMLAAGVCGGWTGHGVDLLIIDDPIKNRLEAESEIRQNAIHEWATSSAFTRVEPGGSIIVNMTRWVAADLIGHLGSDEDGLPWEVVNLPALTYVEREGQTIEVPLWGDRWPVDQLHLKRRLVGEYDWASLFMGSPRPRGGYLFREPARYKVAQVAGARIAMACDPAASAKNSADYSSIVVVGAIGTGVEQKVYILDAWRGQVEIPDLVRQLVATQKRWGAPCFIESAGGFKAVAQSLRAINPALRVVEITPLGDKFTRALPCSAAWNDGRVLLPETGVWLDDFKKEVCAFTGKGDRHDDQVDALAHAFNAVDQRVAPAKRGIARLKEAGLS